MFCYLTNPFTNLDVMTVTFMKTMLQRLAEAGKTILYCTHILEVAETLCPRVMIINEGKLIADANVEELRRMTSQTELAQIFAQLTDTGQRNQSKEPRMRFGL